MNNKLRYHFTLLLLIFCSYSFAQNKNVVDSILNQVQIKKTRIGSSTQHDSIYYATLALLSYYQAFNNPDTSLITSKEVADYAKKNNKKKLLASITHYQAIAHDKLGNYDEADKNYENSIEAFKNVGETKSVVAVLISHGVSNAKQSKFKKAIQSLNEAIDLSEKIKDEEMLTKALFNLSNTYVLIQDYDKAKDNYKRLLQLNIVEASAKSKAKIYNSLSVIEFEKKRYNHALTYANKALRIKKQLMDDGLLASSLMNAGKALMALKEFEKAEKYFLEVIEIRKRIKDQPGLKLAEAKLLELSTRNPNEKHREKPEVKVEENAQTSKLCDLSSSSYYALYETALAKGNFEKAYEYFQKYQHVADSLMLKKHDESLLKSRYGILAKENAVLEANAIIEQDKLNKNNNTIQLQRRIYRIRVTAFVIIILLVIVLSGLIIYYRIGERKLLIANKFLINESSMLKHSPVVIFEFNIHQKIEINFISENFAYVISPLINKNTNADDFFRSFENYIDFEEKILSEFRNGKKFFDFTALIKLDNENYRIFDFYFLNAPSNDSSANIIAYMIDNSAQKSISARIESINNLIQESNKLSGVGGWSYDLKNKSMFWTDYIYELHGLGKAYVPNPKVNLQFFNGPVMQRKITKYFTQIIKKGEAFDDDFEIITANKEEKIMRVAANALFDGSEIVRIDGILHDITDLKNKEKKLRETYALAAKQNKQLQSFAYIVSHNLRSNVANFESIIQLLKIEDDPFQRQMLFQSLMTNSERLKETLNNLNDVIQVQSKGIENLRAIDVFEELEKIKNSISYLIKDAEATISFHFYANPIISFIPAYFESIFLNLLTNAIKYRHPEKECKIEIIVKETLEFVKIEVKDNGIGIDMKKHGEKLFGMYKTFHKNEDARGIGLFLVKNQVESMRGSIEAESIPGQGSTFTVFLNKLIDDKDFALN
jgi:signal transduction histidine kinase/tetratricopeptide (TPR) repeat protein